MSNAKKLYYDKRAEILVKNLKSRHFDAYYCTDKESALEKALEFISKDQTVSWGGCESAAEIGLIQALQNGCYSTIDRSKGADAEERTRLMKQGMMADIFITGANGLSLDGQMVNIDGTGNRVAPIVYGPDSVIVIAGMNKVEDTIEDAVHRARTVAAPINKQRFENVVTPCSVTGACADCKAEGCICNQILITRHCRPVGRIKFILVGEDLGF